MIYKLDRLEKLFNYQGTLWLLSTMLVWWNKIYRNKNIYNAIFKTYLYCGGALFLLKVKKLLWRLLLILINGSILFNWKIIKILKPPRIYSKCLKLLSIPWILTLLLGNLLALKIDSKVLLLFIHWLIKNSPLLLIESYLCTILAEPILFCLNIYLVIPN